MQTISLKLPDDLLARLNREAKARRVTKSRVVRDSLEAALQKPPRVKSLSCYDLARDLAGKVKGLPEDLVENPEYLRSSFLKGSRHRAENRRKAGFNPRGAPLVRSEG